MQRLSSFFKSICLFIALGAWAHAGEPLLSIKEFEIVRVAPESTASRRAVEFFEGELAFRGVVTTPAAAGARPLLQVGTIAEFAAAGVVIEPIGAEGFELSWTTSGDRPVLRIAGADARGVLFGAGRLVRELRFDNGDAVVSRSLAVRTAPQYALRGVQLGFRALSNTYGNWTLAEFDRQIRDLILYGMNALELVAGLGNENFEGLTRPAPEMLHELSKLADHWGLDVWLWTPAREHDYSDPKQVAKTLGEWRDFFRVLPRLDGIFVPGGDPGETPPSLLLPLVEQQTEILKEFHPNAKVWISAQSFGAEKLEMFLGYLQQKRPKWLTGVISAPWTEMSTADLRRAVPQEYALRLCADIGHVIHCQYPVPGWDMAFAIGLGREPICPRPVGMKEIVNHELRDTIGGIAYSDGVTDDVNKVLWLALSWDPQADLKTLMRDYGRTYMNAAVGDRFGDGLMMLEENWRGDIEKNEQIEKTYALFSALEQSASESLQKNWRFLSALYRANYDYYLFQRARAERSAEREVNAWLREATAENFSEIVKKAEQRLVMATRQARRLPEREKILQLGDALHATIKMKLSTKKHGAVSTTRGANLDSIDWPVNNRRWLEKQFKALSSLKTDAEKAARLREIGSWSEIGPGEVRMTFGADDRMGAIIARQFAQDPSGHRDGYVLTNWIREREFETHRIEWMNHLTVQGPSAVELTLNGLDASADYELWVVYGESRLQTEITLVANGTTQLHGPLKPRREPVVQKIRLPKNLTENGGVLSLRWSRDTKNASIKGVAHVSELQLRKVTQ